MQLVEDPATSLETYRDRRFQRRSLLLDLGDPATSLETYREAILLAPEKAHLNFNLGNSLLHNGQVPEAIAAFQKAIKIDPSLLRAKCAAASLLAINGSYAEAKASSPILALTLQ
ncbi:hypothetical protein T484DRAFT_1767635 [Baffinella frigidus]|nr:hypothetical protein T484DRAFT_1767635 [Cryptophyta sp. CCMP2293]